MNEEIALQKISHLSSMLQARCVAIERRLIEALLDLGASENDHSNRSLLEHLFGTYELLRKWDNPPEICLAGLFHSIYGTAYYKIRSVEISRRSQIRELIGELAEELVYLFCASHHADLLNCSTKDLSYHITDLFTGEKILISARTFRALVEISVANLLEQLPHLISTLDEKAMQDLFTRWVGVEGFASEKAAQQFRCYFDSILSA